MFTCLAHSSFNCNIPNCKVCHAQLHGHYDTIPVKEKAKKLQEIAYFKENFDQIMAERREKYRKAGDILALQALEWKLRGETKDNLAEYYI